MAGSPAPVLAGDTVRRLRGVHDDQLRRGTAKALHDRALRATLRASAARVPEAGLVDRDEYRLHRPRGLAPQAPADVARHAVDSGRRLVAAAKPGPGAHEGGGRPELERAERLGFGRRAPRDRPGRPARASSGWGS